MNLTSYAIIVEGRDIYLIDTLSRSVIGRLFKFGYQKEQDHKNMVSTYTVPKFNVKVRNVWSIVLQECLKASEEQCNYFYQELGMINIIDA